MKFISGIDDIGTMTQVSEGWCYYVLTTASSKQFVEKAKSILESSTLDVFHGKKFKERYEEEYLMFLKAIRKYLALGPKSLLSCTLLNETWKKEYKEFCSRLLSDAYQGASIANRKVIKVSQQLVDSLLTLQRLARDFPLNSKIEIQMDQNVFTKQFSQLEIEIKNTKFTASSLMSFFYNGYRNQIFKNAPEMVQNGFHLMPDSESLMIQAADVIGNFSTAYIFVKLGRLSRTRSLKAKLFEQVFRDLLPPTKFEDDIELVKDDLRLRADGAFTLTIG